MLEVTAEAINDHSILKRTKRFYLRDIGELSETEDLSRKEQVLKFTGAV